MTPAKVLKAYKAINASEKKLSQLAFEVEETPLEGKIIAFNDTPKEYNGNQYFTFKVQRPDGTFGSMSVSRLSDSFVQKGIAQVVNSELNKGKAMLKSFRVSGDLVRNLGKSEAERIAIMVGKSYKAERTTANVINLYDAETLFITPATENVISETELDKLWENTVVSDRLFKFTEIR